MVRCPSHRRTSPVPVVVHRRERRQGYWTCSSQSFANLLVVLVDCQWWSVSHFRTNKWMKCNKTGPCAWSPWNRSCQEDHSEGISSHWRAIGYFGYWQWGSPWSSQLVQRMFHHRCLTSIRHLHSMMHPSDVDRRRRASSWWSSSESMGRLSEVVLLEQEGLKKILTTTKRFWLEMPVKFDRIVSDILSQTGSDLNKNNQNPNNKTSRSSLRTWYLR